MSINKIKMKLLLGMTAVFFAFMFAITTVPGIRVVCAEGDVSSGDLEQDESLPLTYTAELYKDGEKINDVTVKLKEEGATSIGFFSLRDGSDITITRGPQFQYADYGFPNSNWSTHFYTVSSDGEEAVAYCIQPAESAGGGSGLTGEEREDLVLLQKILYYGYGGGQDITSGIIGGDANYRYVWTHVMASYAYRDNDNDFLYGLGVSDIDTELPTLANAISTISDMPNKTEADASKTSLIGNTDGSGYVITEQVELWGDVEVPAGVEMVRVSDDNVYGNTTVSTDGETYYFRTSANNAPDSSTISIEGCDISTFVVKSSGQQDMAYMVFDTNEVDLNITWLTGPTLNGTKLTLKKLGQSPLSISGTEGNYTFSYANAGLSGVVFELYAKTAFTGIDGNYYAADQLIATATTDSNGQAIFNSVQFSNNDATGNKTEYYIKEKAGKAGYLEDTQTTYDATLTWVAGTGDKWSGNVFTNNVATITNARQKANVALWKTAANSTEDGPSTNYLQGAEYTLYAGENILNSNGQIVLAANKAIQTAVTDDTGKAQFTADIPYGYRYYIKETKAPLGYAIDKNLNYSFTWTTTNRTDNTITLPNDTLEDRTVYNKLTEVKVSKKDATNSEELPGAKLAITDEAGNIIEEWVSGTTEKVVRGLHNSDKDNFSSTSKDNVTIYTLTETKPADGYATAESIEFILLENDVYTWVNSQWVNMTDGTVTMYDETTKFSFSKYERINNTLLPGATLAVKDTSGREVERWVSTDTAHTIEGKLIVGQTYTLNEITPPAGYAVASPVTFTVADNGEIQTVDMSDAFTNIIVSKYDAAHKDQPNMKQLIGATLAIKDATGKEVTRWVTAENPLVLEGKLIAGATYTLEELEAPEGYDKAEPIQFTVPLGEQTLKVDMYDDVEDDDEEDYYGILSLSFDSKEWEKRNYRTEDSGEDGYSVMLTAESDALQVNEEQEGILLTLASDEQANIWFYVAMLCCLSVVGVVGTCVVKKKAAVRDKD